MNYTIERMMPTQLREAAKFIAAHNNIKEHHIGYCGQQEQEIFNTLNEDFIDGEMTSLFVAYQDGKIVALIGLDIDEDCAEVWGPFSIPFNVLLQEELFFELLQSYEEIRTFYFFINELNSEQSSFMNHVQAQQTGRHLILEATRETLIPSKKMSCSPYLPIDFEQFEKIHLAAFPNTYYDAQTIVRRLQQSNEHFLKILKQGEIVQGYAYFELDLQENEAHIEYIAIDPAYQGTGLGKRLLIEVLTEIFSFENIPKIVLCVENENDVANALYFKVGFIKKDTLVSFKLEKNDEKHSTSSYS
ncbi:MAG: GNAT family N-acetyltransferase [Solibacillus sp.]|uniref:GNAT family N-acetyltransferase n=1 Tax=unclassified Solibacillus TaxID=2637870 RepID=UPI0030F88C61